MTYEQLLADAAERDERIIVMTAENRAAIRNLPDRLGDRFIDVGICEATMIGAAAGLALRGRIPVTHALATFLTLRAFEFIRTDVGIPGLPVKLVGGVPGVLSDGNGPTHQAIEDVALMRGIPNMKVFAPADNDELLAGMEAILDDPSPWYIRYNALPAAVGAHQPFAIGRAETIGSGTDVALITYGFLFGQTLEAKEILRLYQNDDGFHASVNQFIHDFEAMLRLLIGARDGSAISVTLLSSDIGKLYVALAQAIDRLRN